MNFLNLPELAAAVSEHQISQHDIKGKRIKKELNNLEAYHNQRLTFKRYYLATYGISFFNNKIETQYENKLFDFEIFIDTEYPFNRPKVFYQSQNSPYAYGQDLLDNLLDAGGNWGPSMLLNAIFDKLYQLAKLISSENDNISAVYHINDLYEEELLARYKVELFKIDQYQWKYMIKSTFKKVLGITKETLLKFVSEGGKLKLEYCIKIKDLKEANASINNGRYKLDIVCNGQAAKSKYYFGGEEADIQKILYFMNPIQVTERKLSRSRESQKPEEVQQAIKQYSQLIEYYSLRDPEKTKGYVNMIQELIKKNYQNQIKQEEKIEKLQEDIKT